MRRLARAYGVQTTYVDATGTRQDPDPEALLHVLRLLGAELESADAADDALRARRLERFRQPLPPTVVAWNDRPTVLSVRLPATAAAPRRLHVRLEEGGAAPPIELDEETLIGSRRVDGGGAAWTERRHRVAFGHLPVGYHRVRLDDADADALLLVAPSRVYAGPAAIRENRAWGVFLPVHAIRREHVDAPIGNLDDLAALFDWVTRRGGHVVGTLPLLATSPDEPSPYSPLSRLFWSEAFLPVAHDGGAGADARLVDYDAAFARVRAALGAEAEAAFADGEPELVTAFRRVRPDADEYARFRATTERRGESWHMWPERLRDGELRADDYDEAAYRYHLYAQARLHERLERLSRETRAGGAGLYLDLPLGVHSDGYDVWRYRDRFALGASVGAPPDPFFTRGQDWGFPPLRPDAMRAGSLDYTIATIRNHLRYAGVLRLDHVMGLHRQFWVPHGMDATRGVYVRYPANAFYALLAVESHRHEAAIVGENLGTVPGSVRRGMRRHGVRGMHVVQFEVSPDRDPAVGEPQVGSVASLNTHDMPTFTAFWTGRDLRQRMTWGLLESDQVEDEERARRAIRQHLGAELGLAEEDDAEAATTANLERLARSDAGLVLVNLEDLWGELEPQNVPGTWRELPNWRRRARYTLEEIERLPRVDRTIEMIDRLRRDEAS